MSDSSWLTFRLAVLTFCVFGFSNAYFLLASYLENLGTSSATAGFLVSAFYGATLLTRPLAGSVIERWGVRPTLFAAGGLCLLGGAGLLGVSSSAGVFLCRVVSGMGFSFGAVALAAYQGLAIPPEQRGTCFALTAIGSIVTMITVIPLGEALLVAGYPRGYLALPPILAAATLALGRSLPPLSGAQRPAAWGTYRELLGHGAYRWVLGTALCFSLADAAVLFVSRLTEESGLSSSPFMAATAVGAVLARTLGLRWMAPGRRPHIAAPAAALMGIAVGLLPFAGSQLPLTVLGLLYGVGVGFAYPVNLSLVGDFLAPALRPKGTAGVLLAMDVCWMAVPLALGILAPLLGLARSYTLFAVAIVALAGGLTLTGIARSRDPEA